MSVRWVSTNVFRLKRVLTNPGRMIAGTRSKITICALKGTCLTPIRKFAMVGLQRLIIKGLLRLFLDIDECQFELTCPPQQTCINTIGSYECKVSAVKCPPGFYFKDSIQDCEGIPLHTYNNYYIE